jgi:hypothetical protein
MKANKELDLSFIDNLQVGSNNLQVGDGVWVHVCVAWGSLLYQVLAAMRVACGSWPD